MDIDVNNLFQHKVQSPPHRPNSNKQTICRDMAWSIVSEAQVDTHSYENVKPCGKISEVESRYI